MRNFQDTFETRKRSFISAFSICMTAPLMCSMKKHPPVCSIKKGVLKNFAELTRNLSGPGGFLGIRALR